MFLCGSSSSPDRATSGEFLRLEMLAVTYIFLKEWCTLLLTTFFLGEPMTNVVKFPGQENAQKQRGPVSSLGGSRGAKRKTQSKNTSVKARSKHAARIVFNALRMTVAVVLQALIVVGLNILYSFRKLITFMAMLGMAVTYYSQGITYVADSKGTPATIYTFIACFAVIALVQSAHTLANFIIARKVLHLLIRG